MRGTFRTWASSSSAERRGASTFLRVKNPLVHSRIRRTVHAPPVSLMRAIVGRGHRPCTGGTASVTRLHPLPAADRVGEDVSIGVLDIAAGRQTAREARDADVG